MVALELAGNATVHSGVIASQGGPVCQMRDPLDFALVRQLLATDNKRVELATENDLVFCRHCWTAIYGPNHRFEHLNGQSD